MRLFVSGGGTGGHVYPALTVIQTLGHRLDATSITSPTPGATTAGEPLVVLFIGGVGGVEEALVRRAGVSFAAIHAGGLHGLGPLTVAKNLAKLAVGLVQTWRLAAHFRPDAVLLTGGYVGIPVALVAWLQRVPILLYAPDVEPAASVKLMGRFAQRIAVTVEASQAFFPAGKTVVTGYPVRPALQAMDKGAARRRLGLEAAEPTLLVFGGSRGARNINRALAAVLDEVLSMCQVIHISGPLDYREMVARRATLPDKVRGRYHLFEYLHEEEMGAALAAADLAVARAGASTLGEFSHFGLPAILVPYPYTWRYQKVNADYLAERGGALRLDDERLGNDLLPTLRRLLATPGELKTMAERMRALARPEAAVRLAEEVVQMVQGRGKSALPSHTVAAAVKEYNER